jgi:hypothetical protein
MKLNPVRSDLIWAFVESYLQLTADEVKQYERDVASLAPGEQEEEMPLISSIARQGMHDGKESILLRIINRPFGTLSSDLQLRLEHLSSDELDQLSDDFLDFSSLAELEAWLARH